MLASKLSDYTRRQNFLKGNPFVNATPLSPHIKMQKHLFPIVIGEDMEIKTP